MGFIIQSIIALVVAAPSFAGEPPRKPSASPDICATSGKFLVKASKPTVTVIYTEPTTTIDDKPLTSLGKTVIYYDLGHGLVKAKEVPASKPSGGGEVSEVIAIPLGKSADKMVTICVTAENAEPTPPRPIHDDGPQTWKGIPWR
jgi:hypothetical protein